MGARVIALAKPAYSEPLSQKMASGSLTVKERVQPIFTPNIRLSRYYH